MTESKLMRSYMNRLGSALLFSLLMFYMSGILPNLATLLLYKYGRSLSDGAYFAIIDFFDALGYALSFFLPTLLLVRLLDGCRKADGCFGRRFRIGDYAGTSPRLTAHPIASVLCAVAILNSAGTLSDKFIDLLARFGLDLAGSHSYSIPADTAGIIVYFLSLVIIPAFFEELLYRGVILGALSRFGRVFAIIVSSLLFGMMHCSFTQFFYAVCSGIVMGYLVSRSGSIWMGIFVHLSVNLTAFVGDYIWVYADRDVNIIVTVVLYGAIYFAGLLGALILIRDDFGRDIYGEDCTVAPREALCACLCPTMVIYALSTLLIAVWNIAAAYLF